MNIYLSALFFVIYIHYGQKWRRLLGSWTSQQDHRNKSKPEIFTKYTTCTLNLMQNQLTIFFSAARVVLVCECSCGEWQPGLPDYLRREVAGEPVPCVVHQAFARHPPGATGGQSPPRGPFHDECHVDDLSPRPGTYKVTKRTGCKSSWIAKSQQTNSHQN